MTTFDEKIYRQIMLGEQNDQVDPKWRAVAETDIGRMHRQQKPIQYARQPSSKAYSQWEAVRLSLGLENVNDLIDKAAEWVFWLHFRNRSEDRQDGQASDES